MLVLAVSAPRVSGAEDMLEKINPAWARLDRISQSYLTDEQQKTIQELAFATAVGEICDGFEVDRESFVGAFGIFSDAKLKAMSAEDRSQHERKLLVLYGIATGLFSAEGLLAKEGFCQSAASVREQPAGRFWKKKG